jgi:hypothetical protein
MPPSKKPRVTVTLPPPLKPPRAIVTLPMPPFQIPRYYTLIVQYLSVLDGRVPPNMREYIASFIVDLRGKDRRLHKDRWREIRVRCHVAFRSGDVPESVVVAVYKTLFSPKTTLYRDIAFPIKDWHVHVNYGVNAGRYGDIKPLDKLEDL